ncbi:hypothetical protein GHO42_23625, partial [Pseudomonas sp. FSL R10-0056]|nr:hypothetical protein [Pseudomonas sp. FSL R10-0056]
MSVQICDNPPPAFTKNSAHLMTDESPAIDQLLKNLDQAMIADRHKLRRQLHELRKKPDDAKLAAWAERVQAGVVRLFAQLMQ